MTWRELRTFIRRIPADSAYVRAAREALGEDPDWTVDTHIMRVAANAVTTANYQRAGKRTPRDALIPEPGKATKKPRPQVQSAANGAKKPGTWKDLDALF